VSIFDFKDEEALGNVVAVDTATVVVRVDSVERLRRIQVNRLAVLRTCRAGHHLIGLITRITRKIDEDGKSVDIDAATGALQPENNLVRITLIGTLKDRDGDASNVFLRTLETVPDIDSLCFALDGTRLTSFMQVISSVTIDGPRLSLGRFSLDEEAEAFLNGNRLFQRHAVIVGSTGSGKSWTTARLLGQMAQLPQTNAILFDIHGEYKPLQGDAFRHIRVAGPMDIEKGTGLKDGVLHLPYWLLGYDALISLFVDRSDQNAPNQSMMMARCITDAKRASLSDPKYAAILENFTIDSPIPFDLVSVLSKLEEHNSEMVPGAKPNTEKQGPYFDKLSRLVARLEAKRTDRRLGFLFQPPAECMSMDWLGTMMHMLISGRGAQPDAKGGIKVIDFSEVPSDVLPLMVSLLARAIFTTNQWTERTKRHPIALLCDEAHLYIPERANSDSSDAVSVQIFERIAKEGRKYGIGLVVISQRPAEVNRTVLSQCSNVVAMRLTNGDDQAVIKRLLPDSLGSFGDLLPVLDTGEALVVGDASLLPTRVRVAKPSQEPDSHTVAFWDRWNDPKPNSDTENAVSAWRRQSFQP
jgi:uncharacterized protein